MLNHISGVRAFVRLSSTLAAIALVLGCAPVTVLAQGPALGEVARKEQERRKAQPNAGKVYTNKDLPASALKPEGATQAPPASTATPVEGQPGAAEGQEGAQKAEQKGEEKPAASQEAAWKKRMSDAREELRRAEMFAQALQTRVNSLTSDYLSRSDPAQKARLGQERKEAQAELARVKQDIERAKKQIADIEEEARKAGVPPGWLR
jgi:hypothetical protein